MRTATTPADVEWVATIDEEDGTLAFRIGRRGGEVFAEWIGIALLTAARDGSNARLEPSLGAPEVEVEKIRHGSAALLLRHLKGKPAMHGAVVGEGWKAIALLGRSGRGKSTLAAAMCNELGTMLYSDDAIALEPDLGVDGTVWRVLPMEAKHYLDASALKALGEGDWPDQGKHPRPSTSPGSTPARLVGVVELSFVEGGEPSIQRVQGVEAMASVVPHAVRFAVDDADAHLREIEWLGRLVEAVPVYRFSRRRDFALLPAGVEVVRDLLRQP